MSETAYGTDDGFRRAMANANRMRVRSLGVATCATAVAVALTGTLVVPTHQSSGDSRLDMVTTPVTPRPSWTPLPDADPYVPAQDATQERPVSGDPARDGRMQGQQPRPGTTPLAPRRRPQSTPMTRSQVEGFAGIDCTLAMSSWCFKTALTVPEHPAHTRLLAAELCGTGNGALAFDTSAEVEMTVLDSRGRVVWSWLADHPPARQPHMVSSATGTCLRWTAKWYERTNAGVALPRGRYKFTARLLARSPSGIPGGATNFTL